MKTAKANEHEQLFKTMKTIPKSINLGLIRVSSKFELFLINPSTPVTCKVKSSGQWRDRERGQYMAYRLDSR